MSFRPAWADQCSDQYLYPDQHLWQVSTQQGESPLITGCGVIEPMGHVPVIYIAVPGAALAYRLYSVYLKKIPGLHL